MLNSEDRHCGAQSLSRWSLHTMVFTIITITIIFTIITIIMTSCTTTIHFSTLASVQCWRNFFSIFFICENLKCKS